MTETDFSLNQQALIPILIVGIVVFIVLRSLLRLINTFNFSKRLQKKIAPIFPYIEGAIWLGYIFWAIQFAIESPVIQLVIIISIIVVLLVLIAWFSLRDFIAGIILRTDSSLVVGDRIGVKGIVGKVVKMGYRSLQLETDQGEIAQIPYSKISSETRLKKNPSKVMKSHRFEVFTPKTSNLSQTIEQVQHLAMNAAWASLKRPPIVKLVEENAEQYHLEIVIYSLRVEYFQKIKTYLQKHFEGLSLKPTSISS